MSTRNWWWEGGVFVLSAWYCWPLPLSSAPSFPCRRRLRRCPVPGSDRSNRCDRQSSPRAGRKLVLSNMSESPAQQEVRRVALKAGMRAVSWRLQKRDARERVAKDDNVHVSHHHVHACEHGIISCVVRRTPSLNEHARQATGGQQEVRAWYRCEKRRQKSVDVRTHLEPRNNRVELVLRHLLKRRLDAEIRTEHGVMRRRGAIRVLPLRRCRQVESQTFIPHDMFAFLAFCGAERTWFRSRAAAYLTRAR